MFATGLSASCERFEDPGPDYTYTKPEADPGGLAVSTLQNEGIDETLIATMTNRIIHDEYKCIGCNGMLLMGY